MRVIAGAARGTRLLVPKHKGVRPSSDRTRQILFDTLQGWAPACEAVLDLFAGSGAIGIEALSRGAQIAYFVEKSRTVAQTLFKNLEKTHLKARARVMIADAFSFLSKSPPQEFDCIFIDPPYAKSYSEKAIALLAKEGWLAKHGVCVVEESRRSDFKTPECFTVLTEKHAGDTTLWFLKRKE